MSEYQYKSQDRDAWIYHKDRAPKGKLVSQERYDEMIDKDGWVDSPDKFGVKQTMAVLVDHKAVEDAVATEKELFCDSVIAAIEGKTQIPYNEVYIQMSGKELKALLEAAGLESDIDLRKGVEAVRAQFDSTIKAYNNSLAGA